MLEIYWNILWMQELLSNQDLRNEGAGDEQSVSSENAWLFF